VTTKQIAVNAIYSLAESATVGIFIDRTLTELAALLDSPLVSFNELDLVTGTAAVSLRPYLPGHSLAVDNIGEILEQHPVFSWYTSQSDWTPVRLSQLVAPWVLEESELLKEMLRAVGGQHMMTLLLSPPGNTWVYFVVNRADRDFTDDELDLLTYLQPGLVALFRQLSSTAADSGSDQPALTRRELTVLKMLAAGLTADAIGSRLGSSPATVRKHLQHLYGKMQTHDRLTTVIRGRDLGLLAAHDLSTEFTWNVRMERRPFASADEAGSEQ
jgi:DNA-binding CsgD family transcriptional regulator